MKKYLFLLLFVHLMFLTVTACDPEDGMDGAQGQQGDEGPQGDQGDDGLTPVVEIITIAVGEEPCAANGGNTVVVTTGSDVQMVDICIPADGIDGPVGPPGPDGMDSEPITTTMSDASLTDCPFGGDMVTIFQGGVQVGDPIILCDGEDGTNLELACGDLTDNDGDSLTDCADPDCVGQLSTFTDAITIDNPFGIVECVNNENVCTDNFDNDGDGFIDTADFDDCFGAILNGAECGEFFGDIFIQFEYFAIDECTCDFTTFDDLANQIDEFLDVDGVLFPLGGFGRNGLGLCEVDSSMFSQAPTTFNVSITCVDTESDPDIVDNPVTVMDCSAQ